VTLRVGMIGAGNMASVHAGGWAAAGDPIVGVFDPDPKRAARFATDHETVVVDDFTQLAASVDVVDICTPTHTHASYIAMAADAGIDVVCEKPLARTGSDALAAIAACDRAGVQLLVGHVVRFFPEYTAARELAVSGEIGTVGVVRLDRSTYLPAGASAWFSDHAKSGGVVHDLMIHDVDYARWLAGEVQRVYAKRIADTRRGDHVLATLRHEDGAISHLQGSWAYPVGSFRTALEIAGSDGLIVRHVATPFAGSLSATEAPPDVPEPPASSAESPYVMEIRHFSDVLQGRAEPRVTALDGARAVAVCDAIALSIETNRAVEVAR
jgi:predicted dehydrogenase